MQVSTFRGFVVCTAIATAFAAGALQSAAAGGDWLLTLRVDGRPYVSPYEPGDYVSYVYGKDPSVDDFVGVVVRCRVGTMDENWRDWLALGDLGIGAEKALDLIASLHPICLRLQLVSVPRVECLHALGGAGCDWPSAAPLAVTLSRNYPNSVGLQTKGWELSRLTAPAELVRLSLSNTLLLLFAPQASRVSATYALRVWDMGLDSWNDGGAGTRSGDVSVDCALVERAG